MSLQIAPGSPVGAVTAVKASQPLHIPTVPPPPDVANISPFGDLIGKLRELSATGPGVIQQTLSQLQHIVAAAAPQTKGAAHDELVDLGARLATAAQTGDLAPLQHAAIVQSPRGAATAQLLAVHVMAVKAALGQGGASSGG